jgi:hypothetical protein
MQHPRGTHSLLVTTLAGMTWLLLASSAAADKIPPGYVVLSCTISPDGRLGVLVPKLEELEHLEMTTGAQNQVIELATGNIVAVIRTDWVGATRQNHGGVLPAQWSRDNSILLWQVDGKWFRDAVVLLKFRDGKLDWQTDITRAAQAECLLRTRRAEPRLYAQAMADHVRDGKAYPDGFSVQVSVIGDLKLPLQVRATLTSNPKALEELGMSPPLESTLVGFVDSEGCFQVNDFKVGKGFWKKYAEDAAQTDNEPCRSDDLYVPPKS